jgi:predicted enzyme related to lactoylglutathione lyase
VAERKSYVPGTPSWVDLGTAGTEAAARFYGELFGWSVAFDPRPEAGGYGMFTLRGRNVAGIGPQANPGPPYWAVYVSVADVDETVGKIAGEGGKLLAGPMDVFTAGRMAVAQDTAGTVFSVWQPGDHIGAEIVNEPGAFIWNELATTDLARARDFYRSVFGWGTQAGAGGDNAAIFTVGDNVVCGAHAANPGEPQAWVAWFAVDDCDASTAKATGLGGSVFMPPTDLDFGRGAVLGDPQGAAFGIGAVKPTTQGYGG